MSEVLLKNVTKVFGSDVVAVKNANLKVEDKEFMVLVGPSGCGKSTTLRMIAGLEEITEGELFIGDRLVNDVAPKDRDIAMVFQNYALYPHMTVYDNLAFGLRLRKFRKSEIDARVREAAEILDIGPLLERKPKALSGGQRQRVAVGRAIVRKPKVFLFDEPLSNLDAKLRVQMRAELSKLHQRLETTIIYVTHDQVEAMTMGDRICVLRDGVIQQVDDPITLYDKPVNKFVAGFIGSPAMNFMDGKIEEGNGRVYFNEGNFRVRLTDEMSGAMRPYAGKEVTFGARPEDIKNKASVSESFPESTLRVNLEVVEPMGSEIILYGNTGKSFITARVDAHDKSKVGDNVDLVLHMGKVHFFDPETEKIIV
jgi:multiple sugar transport system ATP-binding protein